MLKSLVLASLLATPFVGLVLSQANAATSPDYACYLKKGNQVIDLTGSVCGFDTNKAAKNSKKNAAFLADVQKVLKGYGRSARGFAKTVEENPDQLINEAQSYCQALEAGKSESEFMEAKYREIMQSANAGKATYNAAAERSLGMASMAMQLAPKHYCPKFANR